MFNNQMLSVDSDKKALKLIEQVVAKLGEKPLPKLLKSMLQVDPSERVTASQALAMLPGAEKLAFPTPTSTLDIAAIDATLAKACPNKKPGKGELGTRRACEILEWTHPMTPKAADFYWRRSPAARALGNAGAAVCATLAAKQYETEAHHPEEIYIAFTSLGEFSDEAYVEDELAVLKDLNYCLAC